MFWFLERRRMFYDPDKCEAIISHYNGDRHMQVLRALAAGLLSPKDIKNYYAAGRCGVPPDETYRLINRLDRREYTLKKYDSGSNHSMLECNELTITDGVGTIREFWKCA